MAEKKRNISDFGTRCTLGRSLHLLRTDAKSIFGAPRVESRSFAEAAYQA